MLFAKYKHTCKYKISQYILWEISPATFKKEWGYLSSKISSLGVSVGVYGFQLWVMVSVPRKTVQS